MPPHREGVVLCLDSPGKGLTTSPVMEQLEEPSEPRVELPLPRKIKVFDGGWKSDDTKVFDIDKGHTHTHISKYSQVS